MQRLDDAGKSGQTAAFRVRTATVYLGLKLNGKMERLSKQLSQHRIRRYQLFTVRPAHMSNMTFGIRKRPEFMLSPTVHHWVRLEWCHARSTRNCADWGHIIFSDESHFQLCSDDNFRRVLPMGWGYLPWLLQGTQAHNKVLWFRLSSPLIAGLIW